MRAHVAMIGIASLLGACSGMLNKPAATVGGITSGNEDRRSNLLVTQSRGLLRPTPSSPVEADPWTAIRHYEALQELRIDAQTRAEALRRAAYLRVWLYDNGGADDGALLDDAIALYRRALSEHPGDAGNDGALYQMARALHLRGDVASSASALVTLVEAFPESSLVADASFRAGELLYAQRRFGPAADAYARVPSSAPMHTTAQHKLAWSRFGEGRYDQAAAGFTAVLDRILPVDGVYRNRGEAIRASAPSDQALVRDSLRGFGLSYAALGGVHALEDRLYREAGRETRHPLLYAALGETLLERERYSDAADAFLAFTQRHSHHEWAPDFHLRSIHAYEAGGFEGAAMASRKRFARRYMPDAPYWRDRGASPEIVAALHGALEQLATHYHRRARETEPDGPHESYLQAVEWYERLLRLPDEAITDADGRVATRMRLAEALFDGGRLASAAEQFARVSEDQNASQPLAHDAALMSVYALRRIAAREDGAIGTKAMRQAITAASQLAERHPEHPQRLAVLTRAAEDALHLGDYALALTLAGKALDAPALERELMVAALSVTGDAHFANEDFAMAETAYAELHSTLAPDDPRRDEEAERLAAAIYRQGERARAAENYREAAERFARVAERVPASSLSAGAMYDAAVMHAEAGQWRESAAVLERFREARGGHALQADGDKRLADAYDRLERPSDAALVYRRIAAREDEASATRREAAWLAAQRFEDARESAEARASWEDYVSQHPLPVADAQRARARLAELDGRRRLHWMGEILRAARDSGSSDDEAVQLLVARARLAIGREHARQARELSLSQPLAEHLQRRRSQVKEAVDLLARAADSGFDTIVTEATFEMASLHHDFARDLSRVEPPAGLDAAMRDEYRLLLEDHAYPLEEQAIALYERNLQWLADGAWDDWVRRSAAQLAELAPGVYGKREQRENEYVLLD